MNRIKNVKKQTIDGVLFLQGVFKNDCEKLEDFFHNRLLSTSEPKFYDKIPLVFCSLDTWPTKTNLLCWNCNRVPKSRPWFEPQSIDPLNKGTIGNIIPPDKLIRTNKVSDYCINVKGIFCSCNCVVRYTYNNAKNLPDRLNKLSMLLVVHEIFTGRKVIEIEPAPLATEMIQYGGTLTELEYQKKIDSLNVVKTTEDNFVNNCKAYFNSLM